jgi:hypothetical protein
MAVSPVASIELHFYKSGMEIPKYMSLWAIQQQICAHSILGSSCLLVVHYLASIQKLLDMVCKLLVACYDFLPEIQVSLSSTDSRETHVSSADQLLILQALGWMLTTVSSFYTLPWSFIYKSYVFRYILSVESVTREEIPVRSRKSTLRRSKRPRCLVWLLPDQLWKTAPDWSSWTP